MPSVPSRFLIHTGRIALALFLALASSFAAADFQTEYDLAAKSLLCDCGCSPQSVHDCACGRAAQMRDEIAAKVRGGQSGQQVLDAAVAANGEKVLISPTATGFNLFAWLAPGGALLTGIAAVLLLARRWRRAAPAAEPRPAVATGPDDPYIARLERDVQDLR